MDVYKLRFAANKYAKLLTVDEHDLDRLKPFDGSSMALRWRPVRMFWETDAGTRPITDFSTVSGTPVFNARALEALGDLLEGRGELLPLEVEGAGEYYAFNVTRLSDALDEERSELKLFKHSGRVMRVARYQFKSDRLAGETIFKLRQLRETYSYVTGTIRRQAEIAGLTGFTFDECVWSDTARAAPGRAAGAGAPPRGHTQA